MMSELKVHDVRGTLRDDTEALYLMDHPDSTEEIPTLDVAPYLQGTRGGRESVAARLREISMTIGFFYLTGHGVPPSLIARMFGEAKRFHSLPEAEKRKIPYFTVGGFKSGYSRSQEDDSRRGNVNIIKDAKPNLMAKFSINREGGSGGLSMTEAERNAVINVWPESLPGFKETLLEYHATIENLGRKFLPLWAASLKLAPDYFDKFFATPHVTMQLLHYPPQKEIGNRQ
jgi:isopenicillin N synthase-like dioxygenase